MRLNVRYSFRCKVWGAGNRGGHRTYAFAAERAYEVPEHAEADAPVVVRHRPFRGGATRVAPVAFRRVGEALYEPMAGEGPLDEARLAAAFPGVSKFAWRDPSARYLGPDSKVRRDGYVEGEAAEALDRLAGGLAVIGGVPHVRSGEPVLCVGKDGVRTVEHGAHAFVGEGADTLFRLDETDLAVERLAGEGRPVGAVAAAMAGVEVVAPHALAADLRDPSMRMAGARCRDALARSLHFRPLPAVQAFLRLRAALLPHASDAAEVAVATREALDAFDGGMDDTAARARAAASLRAFGARGGFVPADEDEAALSGVSP